jgi:hypothetical protein
VAPLYGNVMPSGLVTFMESGAGVVRFVPVSCTLNSGKCNVLLFGQLAGASEVSATYQGTPTFGGSSSTVKITVGRAAPLVAVVCSSTSVKVGQRITCSATLRGFAGKVQGERIAWLKAGGPGGVGFPPTSCTLSLKGSCTESLKGTSAGSVVVKASYVGDPNNLPKSRTVGLTVT